MDDIGRYLCVDRLLAGQMKGLFSWRPVWKPALVGALAIALIVGLALAVPFGQPQEALAAEIAQNDPQVRELLPEGTVVRVVKIVKPMQRDIFHVMFLIPSESIWEENEGKAVMLDTLVNVREKKVIGIRALKVEAAHIAPLTGEDKERAIEIAEANSTVQEILNSGAEIRRVIPLPFFQPSDEVLTINVVVVVLTTTPSDSQVERWIVEVDLTENEVVDIVEHH